MAQSKMGKWLTTDRAVELKVVIDIWNLERATGTVSTLEKGKEFMSTNTAAVDADLAVRPFHVDIAEEAIVDLGRRIAAWRPPEREPIDDQSQGVQLATVQDLAHYWGTGYDWRRCEAKLNTLQQFITKIDGLDVHFIHVRSPHQDPLPLIVSHGWPGSIIEQLKIIEPLTNPTAHGGSASDAFDVVVPSLPGYGFSGKPDAPGWVPTASHAAWAVLMERLGYTRYVAQGGDWGTAISAAMARQTPKGLSASTSTSRRWSRSTCSVTSAMASLRRPPSGSGKTRL